MKPTRIRKVPKRAGGLGAIVSSAKHAVTEMGMARSFDVLSQLNQVKGFDCPGCAWPDPEDRRSLAEFCENGVKAVAEEATLKRVTIDFFRDQTIERLRSYSDYELGKIGRLVQPLIRRDGSEHYEAISWNEAYQVISQALRQLDNPDQAAFYTSGRTSNEAAFLYQLFVRAFGTNNLPDCSNMCHESSGVALTEVLGSGKGSVLLKDFEEADCILVIGQNPGTNHPRMLTTLQEAARRGCTILTINPLDEVALKRFQHPQEPWSFLGPGTALSTLHLPIRINGDVAVLKGIAKEILETHERDPKAYVDHAFIEHFTEGFESFAEDVRQTSWGLVEEASGLDRSTIKRAVWYLLRARKVIACWAMGVTQHQNAVSNIQSIVNLLLLGGHIGVSGSGVCPVRGHSNVQGDRTMGIWERPTQSFLDSLEKTFDIPMPRRHGLSTVETIEAMRDGRVSFFMAMGGNFVSAAPDTLVTASALESCQLTVHVSTKLNRSHLHPGKQSIVLPCLGRTDRDIQDGGLQFISVENSMGIVHSSRGKLEAPSKECRSEVVIVSELAEILFDQDKHPARRLPWKKWRGDYDEIRDSISHVIPGFERFRERIRHPSGFTLPHPVRDQRRFPTATGKARFTVHPIQPLRGAANELLMMTIRSHDQYNTTVYGLDDRYRGVEGGRRVVFIHPDDIRRLHLESGQKVHLINDEGGRVRRAENFCLVPFDIPRGCIATYFPETNVLIPLERRAVGSLTPASKSVFVRLEPINNS